LKDPEKRKVYDQYSVDWNTRQQSQSSSHQSSSRQSSWDDLYDRGNAQYSHDFFESLFGGAPQFRQQRRAAQDYHGQVSVSLEEAYQGTSKALHLDHQGKEQTLKVKIPAGVKSGQKIRLAGQGSQAMGGAPAGDLYLTVEVQKHPLFDVMGNDIYLTLPIAPWEAALGATIVVPTLGGNVDLKIPANSQGGQTLRLKKRGLPGATPGDQYIILKIVIPQPTTEAAKAIYQQMAEAMPFNPRATMRV
jgi:curved DNA-binding protein